MPLLDIFRAVRDTTHDQRNAYRANSEKLLWRIADCVARTWDLGFTAFGGPAVHFQILHRRFVEGVGGKTPWIDEQTYQELFAICQALPGPASTKLAFCIAMIHAGLIPAIVVFLIWSLPGAIGMYGLSLGVQRMDETLPGAAYALLSGLNASVVGIIALAAVQLAAKAITDRLTRIFVIFGACAGLCYNAVWYFPGLILIGGLLTVVWDIWLQRKIGQIRADRRRRRENLDRLAEESTQGDSIPLEGRQRPESGHGVQRRPFASSSKDAHPSTEIGKGSTNQATPKASQSVESNGASTPTVDMSVHGIRVRWGLCIIIGFLATFVTILVTRGLLKAPPLPFAIFANMYLAGTIIFGGGPVVIPLLRVYVVQPGWVSPRDFLIGLAIIQAFPGPNFNFGVFLGALALAPSRFSTILGALLGYVGIFLPGLVLSVGVQGLWRVLRTKRAVTSLLRGINATAVGLVFTAVYRLWEIGYLTPDAKQGQSLALEPWWVVVATLTYAESAWFNVPPAASILFGAVLGLAWYGAVGR